MDIGAVRAILKALARDEVVGIFPQGGLDEFRNDNGHLGIGYLALKSGAPVVPASIVWAKDRPFNLMSALFTPSKARVRYGSPLRFNGDVSPSRKEIQQVTGTVMKAIGDLRQAMKMNE